MIRIAHLSDSHFDERGRLEDVVEVHKAFLAEAREAKVDAIVHAGDWFERRSTPAERNAVAGFLIDSGEVAPLFGVKGNHDQAGDLDIFNLLDLGGHIASSPTVGGMYAYGFGSRLRFLALPWFDKAHLVAGLDATVDAETTRQLTIEAARRLLGHLRAKADEVKAEGGIPILVGHVMVSGSEVSTGQVIQGTTVELSPADILDVGAAYAALGHVHKAQGWFDGRVAYSGSPNRCNFGEPEPKGWRLVTLDDDGRFVSNEFRELPARRMVLLEHDCTRSDADLADFCPLAIEAGEWRHIADALVRVRYRVKAEDLHRVDERAIEASFLRAGAAEIKVEAVVVTEARVRSEEIVAATSTAEKLDAFLSAKQIPVDEPQRARLVEKLDGLEDAAGGSRAAA